MRIVCWQTILMKYHSLFLTKIRKKFSSAAVEIGALRVREKSDLKYVYWLYKQTYIFFTNWSCYFNQIEMKNLILYISWKQYCARFCTYN